MHIREELSKCKGIKIYKSSLKKYYWSCCYYFFKEAKYSLEIKIGEYTLMYINKQILLKK